MYFLSLWYNRNGWLGIKHQVTYLLAYFLLIVIYACCDHITCCVFPGAQILVSWGRWTLWGKCLHALWGSHMFFISLSITLGIFNVSKAHPKLDYISKLVPISVELVACPETVLNVKAGICETPLNPPHHPHPHPYSQKKEEECMSCGRIQ